uniref:Uncharacterized protein n=1 Tax=Arcella intermedia TaxID=1963864 RepID=A0A6B2LKJ9_9EUKA
MRFISSQFVSRYDPTIEDRYTKVLEHHGIPIFLEILDTAGQDTFSSMRELYYKNGEGFALVYSIKVAKSFETVQQFYKDIISLKTEPVPIVLVGNKKDLEKSREVSYSAGKELAQEWDIDFVETSAKTGENIDDIFHLLVEQMWAIKGAPAQLNGKEKKPKCTLL